MLASLPSLAALLGLVLPPVQEDAQRGTVPRTEGPSEAGSGTYRERHALVVGVDGYDSAAYTDLSFAVADAREVARALIDRFGFPEENVRLILDEDATKRELDRALEEWICDARRIDEDDLVVVFFAGHGVTRELGDRGSRGYLVPFDGRTDSRDRPSWSSLIGMNFLEDVSEAIPAKHALFVLDCCFGGLAVRRSAPPTAAGLNARARQVISAGNAEQTVLDGGGGGHSVFTGALLGAFEGKADLDGDGVLTFGEIYNHIGREVERRTDGRQTPLQANFADHEGGSIALFPPEVVPGRMSVAERLAELERDNDEKLAELERLSDALRVNDLEQELDELWPQREALVPRMRKWLVLAREVLENLPKHRESVRIVRQEAYLKQVLEGLLEEGEGAEPLWEDIETKVRWRYETFQRLVDRLEFLREEVREVERRLDVATHLRRWTVDNFRAEWDAAIAAAAADPRTAGVALTPQVGLIPLGPDPDTGLQEFAHLLSGEPPERDPDTGALALTEATGLVFVLVPGGEFLMGQQGEDPDLPNYYARSIDGQGPVHVVALDPFFISKYELTQAVWSRWTGENPSNFPRGRGTGGAPVPWRWPEPTLLHPVEQVTWEQCREVLHQMDLTLPTEAQWEYAARAGSDAAWFTGPDPEDMQGFVNLADRFAKAYGGLDYYDFQDWLDDGHTIHAAVGGFAPNDFGLHDVHGNVMEWCLDGGADYRAEPAPGTGERYSKVTDYRAVRGGSFDVGPHLCTLGNRYELGREYLSFNMGVRPARRLR